jgi:hypothetical protein
MDFGIILRFNESILSNEMTGGSTSHYRTGTPANAQAHPMIHQAYIGFELKDSGKYRAYSSLIMQLLFGRTTKSRKQSIGSFERTIVLHMPPCAAFRRPNNNYLVRVALRNFVGQNSLSMIRPIIPKSVGRTREEMDIRLCLSS